MFLNNFNTWLQLGDFYIEIQTGKQDEILSNVNINSQGLVHFCLWVEDLKSVVSRLCELGIEFLMKNMNSFTMLRMAVYAK
ncbi:VOC family protein [Lysinibacillus sp. NPDC048646]|uniref:VOC family protein n=1 Tax=Lysinibacillus sp. NPDC048646 TaxID=3390574 RepID=UPI003CFD29C8